MEDEPKVETELVKLISEQEYIEKSVIYALSTGWVKETQRDLLIAKYLKPLYQHTQKVLNEVRENGVTEGDVYDRVVRKLNWCLEATRRVGSTESSNILKTIDDYRRNMKSDEEEYAVSSFYEFASGLLP